MPPDPDSFEAKLAALREHFITERLPLLVDDVEVQTRQAAAAGWAYEPTRAARIAAHSLRGIAGTHELPAISQAATPIEEMLARAQPGADDALLERLETALAALRDAARAVRGNRD